MLTPDPDRAVAYGLFSVSQGLAAGISRSEIARGVRLGRWERVERGVLRDAGRGSRPGDELLIAVLRAGPGAVAAFESAAQVYGWELLQEPAKPQLIVPLGSRRPRGSVSYWTALDLDEVVLQGVLPLTSPNQTLLGLAALRPIDDAVVAIDSALRCRTVTYEELRTFFQASQRRGVTQAREALALADPLCGSVAETQVRLLLRRAGLPAPVTQHTVHGSDRTVRTDFAWPWARVVLEVDGFRYHSAQGDFQSDRTKQNALVQAGWTVIRVTVADIRDRPAYVVAQVNEALSRAGAFSNV